MSIFLDVLFILFVVALCTNNYVRASTFTSKYSSTTFMSGIVGSEASSSTTFSSKSWFTVKRGDSTFSFIAFNWNVCKKALSNPHFCHHFCIIVSIFLTCAQAENNHAWMRGFKLLILRSTSSSPLASIYNFTSIVVQLWNSNLNACLNDLCKMTSAGCSLEIQLTGTNVTRIFACLDLI